MGFVVLDVKRSPPKPQMYGLIGVRQCILNFSSVSGKNFIYAVVAMLGGVGVAIARLLSFLAVWTLSRFF